MGRSLVTGGWLGLFTDGNPSQAILPEGLVSLKPKSLNFSEAASFKTAYLTAYVGLIRRGEIKQGEALLVHGASGGVGMAAVQMGKLYGARVIASGTSDEKLKIVKTWGADEIINTGLEGSVSFREEVKHLTDGKGADVIYDPVGGDVFDESIRCINWGGRLLIIGFTSGRIPTVPVNYPLIKGFSVIGVRAGEFGRRDPEKGKENNELAYARGPEQKNPFSPVQAARLPNTAPQEIVEASPERELVMQDLCTHLKRVRGAALIIDYGYARPTTGDSFQAMKHHEFVNPLARPGEADLTAHVNFAVLSQLAAATGLEAYPIAQQGEFLRCLGLDQRAAQLAKASPEAVGKIMGERDRLAAPDQMGHLFKVLGVRHPDMPPLAGFSALKVPT